MDSLISLLEVVVWPITILLILYWFRNQLRATFGRLNKLDASASGISMSFSEKLEATKKLAKQIQAKAVSKGNININPNSNYQELKNIREELKNHLLNKTGDPEGKTKNIPVKDINKNLKDKGILKFETAQLIESFIDLSETAGRDINDQQLKEIKDIYQIIKS